MHPFIKPLTAAILILAMLSAGCTDTGGGSVDSRAAVATATQAATSTPEPTPEATEKPWYVDKPGFSDAIVTDVKTLEGTYVHGVMVEPIGGGGSYNLFDIDTGERILNKQVFPHFDLYSELQPEQARALEDQYGSMKSLIMEQADTDGDGALDKVAVRYEGNGGKGFTHEAKYIEGEGIVGYLSDKIFFDTHGKHIYEVYDV